MSPTFEPAAVEIMLVVRYLEPPAGCGEPNPPGFGTLSLLVGVNHLTDFFLRISSNIIRLPSEGTPMLTSNYGSLKIGVEVEHPREHNCMRAKPGDWTRSRAANISEYPYRLIIT